MPRALGRAARTHPRAAVLTPGRDALRPRPRRHRRDRFGLAYERGASALSYPAEYDRCIDGIVAGARDAGTLERDDVREKLGRLVVENEVMRGNGLRTLADLTAGNAPGPESSI